MNEFVRSIVRGLGQGSIYALLGLGFVIIYSDPGGQLRPAGADDRRRLLAYATWPVVGLASGSRCRGRAGDRADRGWASSGWRCGPWSASRCSSVAIVTIGVDIVLRVVASGFIGAGAAPGRRPVGAGADRGRRDRVSSSAPGHAGRHRHRGRRARRCSSGTRGLGLAMRATALRPGDGPRPGRLGRAHVRARLGHRRRRWPRSPGRSWPPAAAASSQAHPGVALKALPAIILGGLDSVPGRGRRRAAIGVVEACTETYQRRLSPWRGRQLRPGRAVRGHAGGAAGPAVRAVRHPGGGAGMSVSGAGPELFTSLRAGPGACSTPRPSGAGLGLLLVALLLPVHRHRRAAALLRHGLLSAIGAIGLNLVTGYAGQVSLGQAFFLGLGAYTAAVLSGDPDGRSLGYGIDMMPIWLPAAGLVAGPGGLLVAPLAIRLRACTWPSSPWGWCSSASTCSASSPPSPAGRASGGRRPSCGCSGSTWPAQRDPRRLLDHPRDEALPDRAGGAGGPGHRRPRTWPARASAAPSPPSATATWPPRSWASR